MRILADGEALERAPRMRVAAAGLALRGHEMAWAGGAPPDGVAVPVTRVSGGLGGVATIARSRFDVVVGSDSRLPRGGLLGTIGGAHGMVVALDPARFSRAKAWERWGWDALYAIGLVEPAEAELARGLLPEPVLERLALWPDGGATMVPDAGHPDVEVLERACERSLTGHRGHAPRAGVFLDRDGTLVVERGYLSDPAGLELLPGVPAALQTLHAAGFALIVVSNQSGIGRGYFTVERAYATMARLRVLLRAHGVELDGIYFCPHRPEEGCPCRKPGIGLLERAAEDHGLSLTRSVMIGDKRLDVATGQRAGGSGILVRTGYGKDEEANPAAGESSPVIVVDDLMAAADWIIRRSDALPA